MNLKAANNVDKMAKLFSSFLSAGCNYSFILNFFKKMLTSSIAIFIFSPNWKYLTS